MPCDREVVGAGSFLSSLSFSVSLPLSISGVLISAPHGVVILLIFLGNVCLAGQLEAKQA